MNSIVASSRAHRALRLPLVVALAGALITPAFGCATAMPPRELVEARAAYSHAQGSDALRLKPAELHVAKEALDRAEAKFNDGSDPEATVDLAYVARRRAETAEVDGKAAASDEKRADGERQIGTTKDGMIEAGGTRLKAAEGAVAAGDVALARSKDQTAEATKAAEREKAGRIAAEKKATDAMDALARSLDTKKDARGTVITISGGVLFATGKSELLPGAKVQLDKVAEALVAQAEHHFSVEGHTDAQGTDAINDELSQKRADAVRDYLIVRGVAADSISAKGIGSHSPIGDNKSVEGRAMNRRVEIIVSAS